MVLLGAEQHGVHDELAAQGEGLGEGGGGGELAAQVVIDSVVRLLKGALRESATTDESHENGLLEYPQYTRPAVYEGEAVPQVLLNGDHKAIEDWRRTQALLTTRANRPDLFAAYSLSDYEKELLALADIE